MTMINGWVPSRDRKLPQAAVLFDTVIILILSWRIVTAFIFTLTAYMTVVKNQIKASKFRGSQGPILAR